MWRDLRYAVAGLWRSPGFTAAAVAALGLAIGANATIFGLVDGLWFRPPGIENPSRLVWIFSTTPEHEEDAWSWPEYQALRDGTSSFTGVVARGRRGASLQSADGTSELLLANIVSTNFFSTLGVRPALGRLFAPGDEASLTARPAVVLGNAMWRRRFGGDPAVVGTTINLQRGGPIPVVIAGVLPENFRDLDAATDRDLWMPPQTWMLLDGRETFEQRTDRWFDVLAIARGGMSSVRRLARSVQPEVDVIAGRMRQVYPESNRGRGARVVTHLERQWKDGGVNATALLSLVLLVVLITCVNVANLLLARGAARSRELAVRAALGATRARLARQMLIESLVLGVLGTIAGVTLGLWLIRLLPSIVLPAPGFRSFVVFQTDARVLGFTLIVTAFTTLLFGTVPSWIGSRADILPLIKEGGAAGRRRGERVLGPALVIAQIAVSLVLLCAAALLSRSFAVLRHADVGLQTKEVLTAWVVGGRQNPSRSPATREALIRLAALPRVTAAAAAIRAPLSLSGGGLAKLLFLPGRPLEAGVAPPAIKFNAVSRDYFRAAGTPLVAGRLFTSADEQPGEPVVIVNQEFARTYFPGGNALGSPVQFRSATAAPHRIVGIVRNAAINSLTAPVEPYAYLPFWREPSGEATFIVQASSDAAGLAPLVRETLKGLDHDLEPRQMITMRQYVEYWSGDHRATAMLASALGGIGLMLTAVGVYGVVAYRTARRTREIGIRMALGADGRDVLRLVLREGITMAGAGVAIGLPLAFAAARTFASFLYGVRAWDPPAFTGAAAVLLVSVGAAAAIPARRATRTEPSASLRAS